MGVPYKGSEVDILLRVTVYSGIRNANVEAFALCDDEVQFVTGIKQLECWIPSANAKETEINTLEKFVEFIDGQ